MQVGGRPGRSVNLTNDDAIKQYLQAMMNAMETIGYPVDFLNRCFDFSRAFPETDERFTVA